MKHNELIIIALGVWTSILAFLRLTGYIDIDSVFVLGFSVAALLFTLGDFLSNVVNPPFEHKNKLSLFLWNFVSFLIETPWTLGIGMIILYPHFPIFKDLSDEQISMVSDFSTLLALGFVFILLGMKSLGSKNEMLGKLEEYRQILGEIKQINKEAKDANNKRKEITKEMEMTYKQQIQLLSEENKQLKEKLNVK